MGVSTESDGPGIESSRRTLEGDRNGSRDYLAADALLFSDRDKSAVHGLLALGTDGVLTVPNTAHGKTSGSHICPGQLVVRDENTITSNQGLHSSAGVMTDAEKLELLCHYRYQVAPWLDICDLGHPFGITAVQMALGSEQLMMALLGLSDTCVLRKDVGCAQGFGRIEPFDRGLWSDSVPTVTTEVALMVVMEELRYLVSDISRAWKSMRIYKTKVLDSLVHRAFSPGIGSSIYWMFFRLDLSAALANDIPIQMQLPICPLPSFSMLSRIEEVQEKTRTYAHVLLWLCGKALMVYHQQASEQHAAPRQLLDSWLQVFEELDQWYHLRPDEFLPMVDVSDNLSQTGTGFPLLLFVNGAGVFCNQLYHTAMLLLLQCKPRTALLNLQSPTLSPLWHSQRICGIALNNDRRESWDPCLVASFLVAARRMTHESQQHEILEGLKRICTITGWSLDEYLTQLREDWSLLEAF
ncbi:hypothetical protein BO78DRAFT_25136 [Aspergillus sclerotiicarbonarius CBS 121057]|uniref:Transcription factor domain-containing protein n=1 Tax=Aspergillus sclerotiicarbonarius (strain CBS 121057 / IBT 28362) TaxID=1448318 RepID=A0A319DTR6_ASPSB|nr:hypothetical protein BO78DRAFT_25136 [Aspergillus sclerotiicarbonarius CBS 121057]